MRRRRNKVANLEDALACKYSPTFSDKLKSREADASKKGVVGKRIDWVGSRLERALKLNR